ncbi:type IV pilus modification PilV family protein [Thermus albus]|uniref:type IV pilus modification PilV family protein n=1 Tax=Thermus albus TaxID=2908146 RepID=UPI001FA94702|nr:type II secretion system protein [Thermus albus]
MRVRSPGARRGSRGLTLIEVLVALAILGLIGPLVGAFIAHLNTNTRSELRSQAVTLAQERLENLRLQDPQTMPRSGCTSETKTRVSRTFTVQTCYCSQASLCGPGARFIEVRVYLGTGTSGTPLYGVATVFTQFR